MQNRRQVKSIIIDSKAFLRFSIPFLIMLCSNLVVALVISYQLSSVSEQTENLDPRALGFIFQMVSNVRLTLSIGMSACGLFSFVLWVIFSHRIFGPIVPLRRQLQKLAAGDFEDRIKLRTRDEFKDVANDINQLTEILRNPK